MKNLAASASLALLASLALANEAPVIEYQPSPCTIVNQPIAICAKISDDNQVARARVYFRRTNEKFYSYVEMSFSGLGYCGTLPAPLEGKQQAIEYYVQGIDNEYESSRTSTYQMAVKTEGTCDFPPVEKDAGRRAAIKVYATSLEQGAKLPKGFDSTGVTFVPAKK